MAGSARRVPSWTENGRQGDGRRQQRREGRGSAAQADVEARSEDPIRLHEDQRPGRSALKVSIEELLGRSRSNDNNNGANGDTCKCGSAESSRRRGMDMTDVTIRGIDDDVYSQFAAEAKRRGVAIGELTTKVMKDFVEDSSGKPIYRITDLAQLTVSKNDLESIDGQVSFSDIQMLEFADDVNWEIFKTKIDRIEDVAVVILPKSISKFQVLTKARDVATVKTKS